MIVELQANQFFKGGAKATQNAVFVNRNRWFRGVMQIGLKRMAKFLLGGGFKKQNRNESALIIVNTMRHQIKSLHHVGVCTDINHCANAGIGPDIVDQRSA
ncbi:MAG: hypothetical protein RLN85_01740, partial [Pseudomonadales bacterium]